MTATWTFEGYEATVLCHETDPPPETGTPPTLFLTFQLALPRPAPLLDVRQRLTPWPRAGRTTGDGRFDRAFRLRAGSVEVLSRGRGYDVREALLALRQWGRAVAGSPAIRAEGQGLLVRYEMSRSEADRLDGYRLTATLRAVRDVARTLSVGDAS